MKITKHSNLRRVLPLEVHCQLLLVSGLVAALSAGVSGAPIPIPRVPKITSPNYIQITTMPDLGALNGPNPFGQHIVDHGFIQAENGQWQLWACIRGTAVGRLLYGWQSDSLTSPNWTEIGITARADPAWGESVNSQGVETIGAPYFRKIDDTYYVFYHSNGMRAMVSEDGVNYQRMDLGNGGNLLYTNGGRDIMLTKFENPEYDDLFYSYSTITETATNSYVRLRTSDDLLNWNSPKTVAKGGIAGSDGVSAESPFVLELDGYFYLFRASSTTFKTYVYRSPDPTYFGINDDQYHIATFNIKAPELIFHEDQWYISDLGDFQGLRLYPLEWTPESDVDEDGDVDGLDFLTIQRDSPELLPIWNATYSGAGGFTNVQPVPEPGFGYLVLLASFFWEWRSRPTRSMRNTR